MILIVSRRAIMIASRFDHWLKLLGGGGGGPWVNFWGYVPFASQNPYFITVYSVANYRPHLSHIWVKRKKFSLPQNPENVQPHSGNS